MSGLPNWPDRLGSVTTALALAPWRVVDPLAEPVRQGLRRSIRRSLGEPARNLRPAPAGEPFLPRDAVARRVHGDLPAMLIGGMSSLFLQTLHPLVMAGVADHSRYREDPWGRFRRTAAFVEATTFGTVEQAQRALEDVRLVHAMIDGRAPDGRRYSAGDPELLTWVHAAEVWSFLRAYQRYGPSRLTAVQVDEYYSGTAAVALGLGASWVPTSAEEFEAYFAMMRPSLYAGPQALRARDFLLQGVARRPEDRLAHAVIVAAAVGLLPAWARRALALPSLPLVDRMTVVPTVRALSAGVRWLIQP